MSNYPAVDGPDPDSSAALAALLEKLQQRHNGAIGGVLLYGSCLRNGNMFDGLLDLYLLVHSYSQAYGNGPLAAANWMIPPNVFYAEVEHDGQILRSKVTVISLPDFRAACSRRWFQSYIWGRFAQPTRLVYCHDPRLRDDIEDCLLECVHTLLDRALPALPEQGSLESMWERALGLSYATELRSEHIGRSAELARSAVEFYAQVSRHQAGSLAFPFAVYDSDDGLNYNCSVPASRRRWAGLAWALRRGQGKVLSVLRVFKALFTFEGGLDYLAWKLERHTGQQIEIPPRLRRYPLIFMWPFFWGLYRRGIFK